MGATTTSVSLRRICAVVGLITSCVFTTTDGFMVPTTTTTTSSSSLLRRKSHGGVTLATNLVSPTDMMDLTTSMMTMDVTAVSSTVTTTTTAFSDIVADLTGGSSNMLLSFTDQGQNLAGKFFQASLLPYVLFLYFLSFRANRIPAIGNFGFQFVLLFVLATIPSGIICKSLYGNSLADTDWLHGSAELLLTVANILIVWGFKEASTNPSPPPVGPPRIAALATFGLFVVVLALGPTLGAEAHTGFLGGIGNLSESAKFALPWVSHTEPVNALTIPTWAIHFSSVIEYVLAMDLVWKFSQVTKNEKWKGLTWGMLPLHASGMCACTYHLFYNPSVLKFLVYMQAGFTLLGNITCMVAAYRIAVSNGWNLDEVNPFPRSNTDPRGLIADGIASTPLTLVEPQESNQVLATKVAAATLFLSYAVKYGSLGLDLPFEPNPPAAVAIVLGVPAITAYTFYSRSNAERAGEGGSGGGVGNLFTFGDTSLSMADVKKYGVSGTVAYVLTELAFWIVAFPVAATALYQSTGHWPDVINETADRAAVLAFVFAGANVARAFVPLRLGAALALAPWVDENLLGGAKKSGSSGV